MKNSFCVLLAAVIVASCSSVPENFVKVDGGTFMKGWTEKERALYKVNYGKDEDPLAPKKCRWRHSISPNTRLRLVCG